MDLIQYDRGPYKRRTLGHGHTLREENVKPRGEDAEEASPVGFLISNIQPPELGQNKMSVFKSPRLWPFVLAAQSFKRLEFIFNDLMGFDEKVGSDK